MYAFVSDLQLRNTLGKIQTISEQVASKLSRDCQCSISADYVTDGQLSCDPQVTTDVIFRARLSSTSQVSDADLIVILKEWVTSGGAFVVLEYVQSAVEANCDVLLQSFNDPICPASVVTTDMSTTIGSDVAQTGSSLSGILWPIIGAIAGAVVLILVVIIAIQIFNQCRKSRKYSFG